MPWARWCAPVGRHDGGRRDGFVGLDADQSPLLVKVLYSPLRFLIPSSLGEWQSMIVAKSKPTHPHICGDKCGYCHANASNSNTADKRCNLTASITYRLLLSCFPLQWLLSVSSRMLASRLVPLVQPSCRLCTSSSQQEGNSRSAISAASSYPLAKVCSAMQAWIVSAVVMQCST